MNNIPEDDNENRHEYTFDSVISHGILIYSRYNKIDELAVMLKLVDRLPTIHRMQIRQLWCDTKACATYSITFSPQVNKNDMRAIGEISSEILCHIAGGHNEIYLENGDLRDSIGSEWQEGFEENEGDV